MPSTAGSRPVARKRSVRRYLTTGKVGEMLEVSPAAIKKWIQQGKLAAFRSSSIAERDYCANCGTPTA